MKKHIKNKNGFTLVELLIVIAIIGILAGVVLVNSKTGVDKAKKASAVTTASSTLGELSTCADDGGEVTNGDISASGKLCCDTNACGAFMTGHTVTWPDLTSVGWRYKAGGKSGTLSGGDLKFVVENSVDTTQFFTCDFANSSCI